MSATNIPSARRITNIVLNDAMILPYDARPDVIYGKDSLKAFASGLVTFDVSGEFGQPVVLIAPRLLTPQRTIVLVPEAAVNKDHFFAFRKHDIRCPRQSDLMEPEPITGAMQEPPYEQFWFRILLADTAHLPADLRSTSKGHGVVRATIWSFLLNSTRAVG